MEKYDVKITELAKTDIRDVVSYIKNDLQEPVIAANMSDTILDAISTLDTMPSRVAPVRDERIAEQYIRGLQAKNYTVFFRIIENTKTVEVIRVLYSRRDWASLL